jgi:hypothetical protein
VAGVRFAPATSRKERPERQPHPRGDLGFYHLPLYFTGQAIRPLSLFPPFLIGIIAGSVILTWVYNSTGGSLLMVVLLHATINLPLTLLITPLGSQMTLPLLLYFGLEVVAAIVVVIWAGPKHLSRKRRKQEEPPRTPPTPVEKSQTQYTYETKEV